MKVRKVCLELSARAPRPALSSLPRQQRVEWWSLAGCKRRCSCCCSHGLVPPPLASLDNANANIAASVALSRLLRPPIPLLCRRQQSSGIGGRRSLESAAEAAIFAFAVCSAEKTWVTSGPRTDSREPSVRSCSAVSRGKVGGPRPGGSCLSEGRPTLPSHMFLPCWNLVPFLAM